MYQTKAFAKNSADGQFEVIQIGRLMTSDNDVEIEVKYCGVCHGDVEFSDNQLGNALYPSVPGHEISGVVTKVGKNVDNFSVGDRAGIGFMCDSCLECRSCKEGDEVGCKSGFIQTFNATPRYGRVSTSEGHTLGGFSGRISVHHRFAVRIPQGYPLPAAGPVLCAGVTMYNPLKRFGAASGGKRVGILGLGGVGQMGISLAAAMGNRVTAISTSASKEEAAKKMGANNFIVSTNDKSMKNASNSLDLILNTIPGVHDVMNYIPLLARKGTLVQLGAVPTQTVSVPQLSFVFNEISVAGSLIGCLQDTQECIDICAKYNIVPATELITWEQLNDVFNLLRNGNDRAVRYVLDLDKSLEKMSVGARVRMSMVI